MNEKRVKKLLPRMKKILHRDLDLLEASDVLDKYTNMKDTDDMVLEQLSFSYKKGLVE